MMNKRQILSVGLMAALLPLGACGDILDVESPGRIPDETLNDPLMIEGLVVGMSYDLMQAYDGAVQDLALASGELFHGGSYDFADIPRGVIRPEDVNGEWSSMQQARWVAEHGIQRIQEEGLLSEAEFNESPLVARAYLLAGLANRFLGENVCSTVIDGGPEQDHTVHFERAEEQFTQAIQIATAAGVDSLAQAAYAGRASVRAWQGDWAGAVQDAEQVPVDHAYYVIFSTENRNDLKYETHNRFEFTVWNTEFADHYGDARIPWDTIYNNDGTVANGANGSSPMFQQLKYTEDGSDIPATKGTEMLLLRAEAALRDSDIGTATDLMNQARDAYDMDPLPASATATLADAWATLHYERGATVWLEGRRLWDLRRWFNEGEGSPAYHSFLEDRDTCIPISDEERRSNPNLGG